MNVSSVNDYKEIFRQLINTEHYSEEEIDQVINEFIISKNYMTNIQENKIYSLNDLKKYDSLINQIPMVFNNTDLIRKLVFISKIKRR